MRRPFVTALLLIAGISFVLGALIRWQLPKLSAFVMVKIEQQTREKLPVRVLPRSIQVSLFPLGATLTDVTIVPKDELKDQLAGASMRSISVVISPWQLLRGKVRVNELSIDGAMIAATIPVIKKRPGPPLAGLFDTLNQIPVNRISLNDCGARLAVPEHGLILEISDLAVDASKERAKSFLFNLSSASVQVLKPSRSGAPAAALKVDLEAALRLTRDSLDLSILKVRRGDSWINAQGLFKGDIEALRFTDYEGHLKSDLLLDSMVPWALKTFPDELNKVSLVKGRASFEAKIKRDPLGAHEPVADFEAHTSQLRVGKFFVDRLNASGKFEVVDRHPAIRIGKLSLDHPAGSATFENIQIGLGEKKTISAVLKSEGVQVHEMLKALGIPEIPVYMSVAGEIPCSGTLTPELLLNCKGKIRGENILVRAAMDAKGTITAIRELSATGEFTVDKNKVNYNAELTGGSSKGRSSGTIDYETGFKIAYEADQLSMTDIANLADLKIEGSAHIKGTTEGTTDYGLINMQIEANNLWLEDFWLGQVKGQANYRAGELSFPNIQGYYSVSRYSGDVKLDLPKKRIAVAGRVPFFDVKDVTKIFSRRVKLPFAVMGTGQAHIKASGPLAINLMSYDLKSSVYRGTVASETFDQANFDVKSINGEVRAERVQLQKGSSLITLNGNGHPDGKINTVVQGRGLKLEDSVLVSSSGLALSGSVDFDMEMKGPVLSPDTDMRGKLTQTAIGDQGVADSTFNLQFSSKDVKGKADLIGSAIQAVFTWPLDAAAAFALKLTSTEWNFAPAFAAISGPASRKDYEGRLTSAIDLNSATGGFWNATGTAKIDKFLLAHGPIALRSTEPLSLSMKNGQLHVEKFDLSGENLFLKITDSGKHNAKVDLQANGKLDLSLLALLTPFFEDLRGVLSFGFNVRAGPGSTDVLGSAYVEKGFLKFFDFPHPFEDVKIDLLFNQKKVLFNTVKAGFGGGRISATGGMEIKGYKNYPTTLSGQFEKVSLNVPDKMHTSGSGSFSLTGNWFPFTLKASYDIKDGLITKEFGGDGNEAAAIRRDQYLPELLLQERFIPLLVDMDLNFTKGLQVKNEYIDGHVMGTLTVKGNPTKPAILGQITMEKDTKIMVKDTTFEVTNANIQFTDPNEINPKLYIAARAHVQDYDVSLVVQGVGSKPEFSFTSLPSLPEKDIISLLAVGTTDQQQVNPAIQKNQVNQNPNSSSPQLSSAGPLKNNPLSKEIKEKTGFDLQFAPGFDETAATQKIIVRRQFNNKFSVAASQSMGSRRATDAEARYRLNDKISGILSWENSDNLDTLDNSPVKSNEKNQFGLDLEYKFEFK